MKETNKVSNRWISIRVKPDEYETINNYFKETTCSTLSQYVRKVLLGKPVVIEYRGENSHEVLTALNRVNRELSAIGNNFNQAVHKLHTLKDFAEIKIWAELSESGRQILLKRIEGIRTDINQIYQQCVRK